MNCLKFLDLFSGLENLPETVRHTWQMYYNLLAVQTNGKQALLDMWVDYFGFELIEFCEAWSAIIYYIKNGDHAPLTPQEKQLATKEKESMTKTINLLLNNQKDIEKRVHQVAQQTAKAKKNIWEKENAVLNTA